MGRHSAERRFTRSLRDIRQVQVTRMGESARDWRLLTVARAGDLLAFGHLVEQFQGPLARYLWCLGEHEAGLARLLEETFVAAYRALQIAARTSVQVWLYSIATQIVLEQQSNAVMDGLRAVQDRKPQSDPLRDAIASVGLQDRCILILCALEGLTSIEVAAIMNVSPGNVRTRFRRAQARFNTVYVHLLGPHARADGGE